MSNFPVVTTRELAKVLQTMLDAKAFESFPGFIYAAEQRIYRELDLLALPVTTAFSLPVAIGMGAAAILIKNPVVSRRFWE